MDQSLLKMAGSVEVEAAVRQVGSAVDPKALQEAVEFLRPLLHADGGDMALLDVDDDGVVSVELMGACGTCPLSVVTLTAGIEALLLQRVDGVTGVVAKTPSVELPESYDPTE